jgi:hypothetical protein
MVPGLYESNLYVDNMMLNIADVIVAHNQKMIDYLKSTNTKAKIFNLQIFDYLCTENTCKKRFANSLSIAGNLDEKKMWICREIKKFMYRYSV